jgi:hypothetical protein
MPVLIRYGGQWAEAVRRLVQAVSVRGEHEVQPD